MGMTEVATAAARAPGSNLEDHESTNDGFEHDDFDDSEKEESWGKDESEDLKCKQDIEEHEYSTPGDTTRMAKIQLFLADDIMHQSRWMKTFVAECWSCS
ncbi:hypothetical protein BDV41DRAFT_574254 [Aspergillus transmontanensis]|uniref:Uncharacterized protein n=1 Tax=Aspergillus transmontanensis TaxID=1034304 RepID=A0A5N6W5H2_9EURO|nr:hypothetical protein BDV41DRAFT_574254 [Aspergillus transmontanensis]